MKLLMGVVGIVLGNIFAMWILPLLELPFCESRAAAVGWCTGMSLGILIVSAEEPQR